MVSMSARTSEDLRDLNVAPTFAECPPIFVFPTHLALDELNVVEDSLARHGAPLTYDISEARLVLGRVRQKKRAALELRSRGLWTEEVPRTDAPAEPPTKRRRVDNMKSATPNIVDSIVVDLSTESEDEPGERSR
jgi:DNA polymerase IV